MYVRHGSGSDALMATNHVEAPAVGGVTTSVERPTEAFSADAISAFVYDELKRLARWHLRRADARVTLSTTDLVHEAYLRLRGSPAFAGRAHFFGAAARAMRQVLVDFARHARAAKRGGARRRVPLGDAEGALELELDQMLALDAALDRLSKLDERLARIVELRFFAGLPEREIAEMLGVTTRTVERHWLKARLILLRELEPART